MKTFLLKTLVCAGAFAICPVVSSWANPITTNARLWFEWNMVPSTQWAPKTIDLKARPDKSLYTLKLQPVFPFRLNEDWTVLTRTIFRFVSAPTATPELGLTPTGEPVFLGWNQRNRMGLSDVSPTAFFVPNLGPDLPIPLLALG